MKSFTTISLLSGLAAAGPLHMPWKRQDAAPIIGAPAGFGPFTFTSTYNLVASPDKVINGTTVTPGEAGAIGFYNYGINSDLDIICYNITLQGVTGPYSSPAVTATHIHEAAEGASGPPRIAFPNPEPADSGPEVIKRSAGCIQGPFTTGIQVNGADSGTGFTLRQIEANPAGFFTDSHTAVSVPGVVRAQLLANAAGGGGAIIPGNAAAPVNLPAEVSPTDFGGCTILGVSITTRPLVALCLTPGFGGGAAAPAAPAAPATPADAVAPAPAADAAAAPADTLVALPTADAAAAPVPTDAGVAVANSIPDAVVTDSGVEDGVATSSDPATLQPLPGGAPAGGDDGALQPLPVAAR